VDNRARRAIYVDSAHEGDIAVELQGRELRIGRVHYRGSDQTRQVAECSMVDRVLLLDVPAAAAGALALLGPLVERQRALYRRSFFRCRHCTQRLPPSLRSVSAPREQSLCEPCANTLGHESVDY
jgi:hypothetical protein